MVSGVNEKDWKLFRDRVSEWQEAYMEKLIEEYKALLGGNEQASEKFWALEKRINQDRQNPGVLLHDVSRSNMDMHLLRLLQYAVIRQEDLKDFSEELRERIAWFMENV